MEKAYIIKPLKFEKLRFPPVMAVEYQVETIFSNYWVWQERSGQCGWTHAVSTRPGLLPTRMDEKCESLEDGFKKAQEHHADVVSRFLSEVREES